MQREDNRGRSRKNSGFPGLSGNGLKVIAMITMLIDHIGIGVLLYGLLDYENSANFQIIFQTETGQRYWLLYKICRMIGRVSFPIYCFLLVEGFFHTSNRKKYFLRLLSFAVISEIPFNLLISGNFLCLDNQNVYFTLALGIVMMEIMERCRTDYAMKCIVMTVTMGISWILKTDYDMSGILLIAILYYFHDEKTKQLLSGAILEFLMTFRTHWGMAGLAFIPISLYHGYRGKWKVKYLFYWFYPMHMVMIYIAQNVIQHHMFQ